MGSSSVNSNESSVPSAFPSASPSAFLSAFPSAFPSYFPSGSTFPTVLPSSSPSTLEDLIDACDFEFVYHDVNIFLLFTSEVSDDAISDLLVDSVNSASEGGCGLRATDATVTSRINARRSLKESIRKLPEYTTNGKNFAANFVSAQSPSESPS